MKKIISILFCLLMIQSISMAKDTILFAFPNDGWHKIESPDGKETKKYYVPYNQTAENYTEILSFSEKTVTNTGLSPMVLLHKQLGKDRTNYPDIIPEYMLADTDNAMVTWCSKLRNTCVVERAFNGKEGIIFVIYTNKSPHYSQNMFGQWSNILSSIKVYDASEKIKKPYELIEL